MADHLSRMHAPGGPPSIPPLLVAQGVELVDVPPRVRAWYRALDPPDDSTIKKALQSQAPPDLAVSADFQQPGTVGRRLIDYINNISQMHC